MYRLLITPINRNQTNVGQTVCKVYNTCKGYRVTGLLHVEHQKQQLLCSFFHLLCWPPSNDTTLILLDARFNLLLISFSRSNLSSVILRNNVAIHSFIHSFSLRQTQGNNSQHTESVGRWTGPQPTVCRELIYYWMISAVGLRGEVTCHSPRGPWVFWLRCVHSPHYSSL